MNTDDNRNLHFRKSHGSYEGERTGYAHPIVGYGTVCPRDHGEDRTCGMETCRSADLIDHYRRSRQGPHRRERRAVRALCYLPDQSQDQN